MLMTLFNFLDAIVHRLSGAVTAFGKQRGWNPTGLLDAIALWLGWASLTWLAFLLSLLFVEVGEKPDIAWLEGLVGGAFIGFAQWLVLRRHLQAAYRWIVLSAFSWAALAGLNIGAIGWMAPDTPNLLLRAVFGLFYGGYVGLILGIGQWGVMRHQVLQAWRWIPLSAGVWAIAIASGWLIGGGLRLFSRLFVSEVIGLMVAWAAVAALSGLALVGLLYPKTEHRPDQA
jgi:hypothetical protein